MSVFCNLRLFPSPQAAVAACLNAAALVLAACTPAALSGSVLPIPAHRVDAAVSRPATLFYMTDRQPNRAGQAGEAYGRERSTSMAFGEIIPAGDAKGGVFAGELVRFPKTPVPFSQTGGRILPDRKASQDYDRQSRAFQQAMQGALRTAGVKEVVLFVHGFNNSFQQAAETATVLQSETVGRSLTMLFSWPAGGRGLTGYFADRESGEFSVFHLKETLRLLAGVPGLDSIHVVAHSRGAAVTTTALREMVIAARASGRLPRSVLKVDNLILAAPDIDFGVVGQRLIAEQFGPAFGRISVYMNPEDGALGLSQSLLSGTRFGRLTFDQLDENEREIFTRIRNVDFIDVENVAQGGGHSYFRKNPAVLGDIGRVLRLSVPPSDPRRGLAAQGINFWKIVNPPRTTGISAASGVR